MIKVSFDLTADEVVEFIGLLASQSVIAPNTCPRARQKLQNALSDSITELEFDAFQKAVDKYLNNTGNGTKEQTEVTC